MTRAGKLSPGTGLAQSRKHTALRAPPADPSLRNLMVAQGQRHRAGRDTTIQIGLIERLSDLQWLMRNGVAGRALEVVPGFPKGISHA